MWRNMLRKAPVIMVLPILLIIFVVILIVLKKPAAVQAYPAAEPAGQQPDNSMCLGCHGQEGQAWTLADGESVGLHVAPADYGGSVHSNLACQVCHTNISGYPHPANAAASLREYTLQYKDACKQCHPVQSDELLDSAHTKIFDAGNRNAPICADCHNPHSQAPIKKDANGAPAGSEHATIAMTCAKCHDSIFKEYSQSVHGSGVLVDKNPDVPACTDCHGIHTVTGPTATRFRLSSPQLCGKCHTDKSIMEKYGISTDVLTTYVADFHGTTVTLFQKTDPDQVVNTPVCYDCHGVHDILRVDDPTKGLSVKKNILVACQKCHPDATTNFPDSWLSHYIPSKEKYPLVYWVGVFYKTLIPLVLGAMGVFIVTDVGRKVADSRKKPGKAGNESGDTRKEE